MTYKFTQNVRYDIQEDTNADGKVVDHAIYVARVINRMIGDCCADTDVKSWVLNGIPAVVQTKFDEIKAANDRKVREANEIRNREAVEFCKKMIDVYARAFDVKDAGMRHIAKNTIFTLVK